MNDAWQWLLPTDWVLLWPLLVAIATNVACAVVGCFLVLRRMSLLGDALAHAVLPGLVVAFLFSGTLAIGTMFIGAFVAAIATTFLTQLLHRQGGVTEDASMGVVFTALFALGVVLIKRYSQDVHIDASCVLEGNLSLVNTHLITMGGLTVPRAFASIVPVLVGNVLVLGLLWKEFKLSSFDPALATTLGFSANLLHYLLMGLVSLTAVGSFEAVGSILVIAMLIVPASAAHLLCDRLGRMVLVAVAIAVLSAYAGFVASLAMDVEPAAMMAVAAGAFYALAALFSPKYGIVATLARNAASMLRIMREDLLAMLFRLEELTTTRRLGGHEAVQAVGGAWLARLALWSLRRNHLVTATPLLELTETGRARAAELVRSHRLWELYLVEHLGLPIDHVHSPAERMEHYIDESLRDQLAADLHGARDPHGREIP